MSDDRYVVWIEPGAFGRFGWQTWAKDRYGDRMSDYEFTSHLTKRAARAAGQATITQLKRRQEARQKWEEAWADKASRRENI